MPLPRWLRAFLSLAPAGAQAPFVLPDVGLDEAVAAIAALRSEAAIRQAARQFPPRFGPAAAAQLGSRFGEMMPPPDGFGGRTGDGVTAWASRWWLALYEILYQYREHALPVLRPMAAAGYGQAVAVLCRLAAVGVGASADVRALVTEMPAGSLGEPARVLLSLARIDAAVAAVLAELADVPAFADALDVARQAEQL